MRLLAIDTALTVCAAAVFNSVADEIIAQESLPMERGHAEALMPMIARVMDAALTDFRDLGRIAVTVGPGSFTGLRVGISAARGIALACGRPAVGVSTLSAFAAPCIAEDLAATTIALIDARHRHVYLQVFGDGGYTLFPAGYAPIEEALNYLGGEVHLTGSATDALLALWPEEQPPPFVFRAAPSPDIGWVARLGVAADPETAPAVPLYLRAPDAKAHDTALERR